jgi:predicted HAD superfamily hydrolase
MGKLRLGQVKWEEGPDGKPMDSWIGMRGSLKFSEFEEFKNFVCAAAAVFPFCENVPLKFVHGLMFIVRRLKDVTDKAGLVGDKKLEATFKAWEEDNSNTSFLAITKTSAVAVGIESFDLYQTYIKSSISAMRNCYVMGELVSTMSKHMLNGLE